MPSSQSEIRALVTSTDAEVLRQSLEFVKDRLAQEDDRNKVAEGRATAMLAVLGVIAGLVIPQAESFTAVDGGAGWFLLVTFLSSLLFLLRSTFCAMGVLAISKRYRCQPQSIYDYQALTPVESLREEIVGFIWEYEHAIQPNNKKLFFLNRCQRSTVFSVFLLILLGVMLVLIHRKLVDIPVLSTVCFGTAIVMFFFVGDWLAERFGIWTNR